MIHRHRSALVAGITLTVAAAIAGHAWHRTLTAAPATRPQVMTWHRADGSPPDDEGRSYPFRGCNGDIRLELAVWRQGVIVPCKDQAIGAGWAWLDPAGRRAELRWPLEEGAPFASTLGVIPGPDNKLAIVFERELGEEPFVGIAGPYGWVRAPEGLGHVIYQGGAWVGPNLEVVLTLKTDEDRWGTYQRDVIVALVDGARIMRHGPAVCQDGCLMPRFAYRAGGRWVHGSNGRAFTEAGEPVPSLASGEYRESELDRLAHGVLDVPAKLALGHPVPTIEAEGRITRTPPPPWAGLKVVRQTRYVIDHRIRRQTLFTADEHYSALVEQLADGRTVVWHTGDDERLRIADALDGIPPARPIARWRQGLAQRIVYPDLLGGYWMVSATGEHVHLDGALRRTDPRPLREHLRTRGSWLSTPDEPEHERHLAWALFGLPVLLAGAYVVGVITEPKKRRRWRPRATPLAIAAVAYAISAAAALWKVLPLLG